jgi:hypothetical protein
MTIENGTAIVLAYVLVSMGVIIAFLLAAFVIGWFIGRLRQRRRGHRGSNLTGGERGRRVVESRFAFPQWDPVFQRWDPLWLGCREACPKNSTHCHRRSGA